MASKKDYDTRGLWEDEDYLHPDDDSDYDDTEPGHRERRLEREREAVERRDAARQADQRRAETTKPGAPGAKTEQHPERPVEKLDTNELLGHDRKRRVQFLGDGIAGKGVETRSSSDRPPPRNEIAEPKQVASLEQMEGRKVAVPTPRKKYQTVPAEGDAYISVKDSEANKSEWAQDASSTQLARRKISTPRRRRVAVGPSGLYVPGSQPPFSQETSEEKGKRAKERLEQEQREAERERKRKEERHLQEGKEQWLTDQRLKKKHEEEMRAKAAEEAQRAFEEKQARVAQETQAAHQARLAQQAEEERVARLAKQAEEERLALRAQEAQQAELERQLAVAQQAERARSAEAAHAKQVQDLLAQTRKEREEREEKFQLRQTREQQRREERLHNNEMDEDDLDVSQLSKLSELSLTGLFDEDSHMAVESAQAAGNFGLELLQLEDEMSRKPENEDSQMGGEPDDYDLGLQIWQALQQVDDEMQEPEGQPTQESQSVAQEQQQMHEQLTQAQTEVQEQFLQVQRKVEEQERAAQQLVKDQQDQELTYKQRLQALEMREAQLKEKEAQLMTKEQVLNTQALQMQALYEQQFKELQNKAAEMESVYHQRLEEVRVKEEGLRAAEVAREVAQPQAKDVQPQVQEVQPQAQEMQPQVQEVQPQVLEVQPQVQEVQQHEEVQQSPAPVPESVEEPVETSLHDISMHDASPQTIIEESPIRLHSPRHRLARPRAGILKTRAEPQSIVTRFQPDLTQPMWTRPQPRPYQPHPPTAAPNHLTSIRRPSRRRHEPNNVVRHMHATKLDDEAKAETEATASPHLQAAPAPLPTPTPAPPPTFIPAPDEPPVRARRRARLPWFTSSAIPDDVGLPPRIPERHQPAFRPIIAPSVYDTPLVIPKLHRPFGKRTWEVMEEPVETRKRIKVDCPQIAVIITWLRNLPASTRHLWTAAREVCRDFNIIAVQAGRNGHKRRAISEDVPQDDDDDDGSGGNGDDDVDDGDDHGGDHGGDNNDDDEGTDDLPGKFPPGPGPADSEPKDPEPEDPNQEDPEQQLPEPEVPQQEDREPAHPEPEEHHGSRRAPTAWQHRPAAPRRSLATLSKSIMPAKKLLPRETAGMMVELPTKFLSSPVESEESRPSPDLPASPQFRRSLSTESQSERQVDALIEKSRLAIFASQASAAQASPRSSDVERRMGEKTRVQTQEKTHELQQSAKRETRKRTTLREVQKALETEASQAEQDKSLQGGLSLLAEQRQQARRRRSRRLAATPVLPAVRKAEDDDEDAQPAKKKLKSQSPTTDLHPSTSQPESTPEPAVAAKEPLVRAPDAEWLQRLETALSSRPDAVMATSVTGSEIRRRDFDRLVPRDGQGGATSTWLNDEIVNGWIGRLAADLNEKAGYTRGAANTPPFAAFNSSWWLSVHGRAEDVSAIRTWSRRQKVAGAKLLDAERILFPVSTGNHWLLLVVCPRQKRLQVLDSLGGRLTQYFRVLRAWLEMELKEGYRADEWEESSISSQAQLNGSDCGVFTCINALASSLARPASDVVSDDGMLDARRMIACVLLNGGFSGEWAL